MNILFICKEDPRVDTHGSAQRNNLLWRSLLRKHDVHTIYLDEHTDGLEDDERIKHGIMRDDLKITHRIVNGLWRRFNDFLGGSILRMPIYPSAIDIAGLYPNVTFDAIVVRYVYPVARLHLWRFGKLWVDVDDHPLQVFDTKINLRQGLIKRSIARWSLRLQFHSIEKHLKGAWIANPAQTSWFNPSLPVKCLPNQPKLQSVNQTDRIERDNYLMTIGLMGYDPNYLGVDYFVTEIWPLIHRRHPELEYVVGGKGAPSAYAEKWNGIDGVRYVGFVEDLEGLYAKSLAAVVPILSGGGTCIKTLEALAHSRVCLATRFGVRGIRDEFLGIDKALAVFEDAAGFDAMVEALLDTKLRCKYEEQALKTLSCICDPSVFDRAVDDCLNVR